MDYVRRCYGVPADHGMQVRVDGRVGTIIRGDYRLYVKFDGNKRATPCHPTWRVEYMTANGVVRFGFEEDAP